MAIPADTRVAPSGATPNLDPTQTGTFDPAAWLTRYTALGGVYVANGKLNLCILVNKQTEDELSQIRQMVVDLTDDDKAAILAHVASEPAYAPVTWQDVVTKYETDEAAFSRHPYARTHPDAPEYMALDLEHKALMVRSTESLCKLLETPAPDHAALCRKVEIIRKEYGDYEGLFSALLADIEQLGQQAVAAPTLDADSAILAAWARRTAAYERYNALPFSDEPDGAYTPQEAAEWAVIDEAEDVIRSAVAKTSRGVAIQLWTALRHCIVSRGHEDAVHRMDLAALEADAEELDGQGRWLVAAIRSLEAMEA